VGSSLISGVLNISKWKFQSYVDSRTTTMGKLKIVLGKQLWNNFRRAKKRTLARGGRLTAGKIQKKMTQLKHDLMLDLLTKKQ